MSLGQSEAMQDDPAPEHVPGPRCDAREATADEGPSDLASEAVPVQAGLRRLERDREERIRTLVARRGRPLPQPSMRALLALLCAAAAIPVAVALTTGGEAADPSPQRHSTPRVAQPAAPAPAHPALAARPRRSRAAARARRRASARAAREATRHRARRRRARAKSLHRVTRSQSPAPVQPTPSTVAATQAPPSPPEPPSTETQPAEKPSSNPQSGPSQVEREFGFEH